MYASLLFPAPAEGEVLLGAEVLDGLLAEQGADAEDRRILTEYLGRVSSDPAVLQYRAELGAELAASAPLQKILTAFAALGRDWPVPEKGELDGLRRLARFERFSREFDAFCRILSDVIPESEGFRRCFRFLKRYAESYEYKELKCKAAELVEAFGFDKGVCYAVGQPAEEGTARLFRAEDSDGVFARTEALLREFDLPRKDTPAPLTREYTDVEAAVLMGVIRGSTEITRRLEEFFALAEACGTEDLLRLSREAAFYTALNRLYAEGHRRGYSLCVPRFRPMGFYTQIKGLCHPSAEIGVGRTDYQSSPMEPVTVLCGPDSKGFLHAIALAHVIGSFGGLIFAEEAEISPADRIATDRDGQISTEGLNEHSLCLCRNLFDAMLPRQEEAAVSEVIRPLAERAVRSVVRIRSKSNLAALQRMIRENILPPCALTQAGADRTLEDLLKEHSLTAEELEETKNA